MIEPDLKSELESTISYSKLWGRRNFFYAHLIFILSVLGSFLSSVLTSANLGTDARWKWFIAVLSALPGLVLLINNTLRFEERTKWFWRKTHLCERYYRALRDSKPDVPTLSKQFTDELDKLELDWPAFGSSPSQPIKPGS